MKRWGDRSIRTKLILGFAFVAGITIIMVGGIAYQSTRTSTIEQLQGSLATLNQAKGQHIEEYFRRLESRAEDFASDGYIRSVVEEMSTSSTPNIQSKELGAYLREHKQVLDHHMMGVYLTDIRGHVLASTFDDPVGSSTGFLIQEGAQFIQLPNQEKEGISVLDAGTEIRGLAMTTPLTSLDTNTALGNLTIVKYIGELQVIMGNEDLKQSKGSVVSSYWGTLEMYLVDAEGSILLEVGEQEVGGSEALIGLGTIAACQAGFQGGVYVNHQGQEVIGVSHCLDNGWFLVAELGKASVDSTLRQAQQTLGFLALITLITMTFLSLLPASSMLLPIRRLQEAAERVSQGDFTARADQDNRDQLGQLGKHFNNMVHELERADVLKKEFISIVSHQLRTPLTSVRLYTDLLSDTISTKTDEQGEYIDAIETSIERMLKLVADLLNLSRLEGGRLRINLAPTDICALVIEEVQAVEALATEKKAKLIVKKPAEPVVVEVDGVLLRQIIHNLLTNAIKYGPEQFGTVEVDVQEINQEGMDWVQIQVSDQGMGIEEED